ncbi:hypothetical protein COBT_000888 [Conglomerata obtusa]
MPYRKIIKTSFVASDHFSRITNNTYQHSFSFHTPTITKPKPKAKIAKTTHIANYEEYLKINKMHKEYLRELKSGMSHDAFMSVLYKAELTGAMIYCKLGKGIVIEERINVVRIVEESGKVKCLIKNFVDFVLELDDIKYIFFGKKFFKNRFLKK